MNPNKALWEKGDFTRIAATMRESGDALVDSLGLPEYYAMEAIVVRGAGPAA